MRALTILDMSHCFETMVEMNGLVFFVLWRCVWAAVTRLHRAGSSSMAKDLNTINGPFSSVARLISKL